MNAEARTGIVDDFAGGLFPRTVSSRSGGLRSMGEIMPQVLARYASSTTETVLRQRGLPQDGSPPASAWNPASASARSYRS